MSVSARPRKPRYVSTRNTDSTEKYLAQYLAAGRSAMERSLHIYGQIIEEYSAISTDERES
jgi:hypothetical protein